MSVRKFVLMAALAVVAVMSMASMASATTRVTCGTGVTCTSTQAFNGHTTGATLTSPAGVNSIVCGTSYVLGRLNGANPSATSVPALVTFVHFNNCSSNIFGCSVPTTISSANPVSWASSVQATGGSLGTLTVNNPTISFVLTCGATSSTCTYSAASVTGDINQHTVNFNDSLTTSGGGSCPTNAVWDANYTVRTGSTPGAGTLVTVDAA